MNTWRMSFRCGNQGFEMWPRCYELGIAAITYRPFRGVDLSQFPKGEPKKLWSKLYPAQKASLRRVAYEMRRGDVIYVKQGPKIIGKGIVQGRYRYDSRFKLLDDKKKPWPHQVPVKWLPQFHEVRILLGAEPLTVLQLSPEKVKKVERGSAATKASNEYLDAIEGEQIRSEGVFRARNRALINAKKAKSDYRCEACGFSFVESYGSIGRKYIIAHHVIPMASKKKPSKTSLSDIALLCANCHAMVHTSNPPLTPKKLSKLLRT